MQMDGTFLLGSCIRYNRYLTIVTVLLHSSKYWLYIARTAWMILHDMVNTACFEKNILHHDFPHICDIPEKRIKMIFFIYFICEIKLPAADDFSMTILFSLSVCNTSEACDMMSSSAETLWITRLARRVPVCSCRSHSWTERHKNVAEMTIWHLIFTVTVKGNSIYKTLGNPKTFSPIV